VIFIDFYFFLTIFAKVDKIFQLFSVPKVQNSFNADFGFLLKKILTKIH